MRIGTVHQFGAQRLKLSRVRSTSAAAPGWAELLLDAAKLAALSKLELDLKIMTNLDDADLKPILLQLPELRQHF